MKETRIVFMGTPVFGKEILRCLVENDYNVVGVVSQPDKAVGRKQIITFCPVKEYAVEKGIEVIQPIKIKEDYQRIVELQPDLIVTCAYGQIIPKALLQLPKLGCINVHASLLPKLRGGAPIQHSIIDGYDETGVTIMEMASKMDAGDMISQASTKIEKNDTYGSLHDRLITIGQKLLLETLPSVIDHSYIPIKQEDELVTFGYNISKEEEHIDLSKGYTGVFNQVRGLIPTPCCYMVVDGKKVKIHEISTSELTREAEDGTIVFVDGGKLGLVVENKVLVISKLQLEGKQVMTSKEVRNGSGRNWDGKVCN